MTARVILRNEEAIDADDLCEKLREQARQISYFAQVPAAGRLECQAARVIEALLRERNA